MTKPFPTAPRLALLAFLALGMAACSVVTAPPQMRGHRVETDLLSELVPGTSTKADVVALLGSPTRRATFDDDVWIYIAAVTRMRIARRPSVDSQDVTVLTFTPQGTLKEIERLTQDDSLPVQVVDRATESPGNELTFLQQFFGNVARLNPSIPIGGSSRGGSGAGAGPLGR